MNVLCIFPPPPPPPPPPLSSFSLYFIPVSPPPFPFRSTSQVRSMPTCSILPWQAHTRCGPTSWKMPSGSREGTSAQLKMFGVCAEPKYQIMSIPTKPVILYCSSNVCRPPSMYGKIWMNGQIPAKIVT